MRSALIEFHRFNDLTTGILRKGDAYLVAAASQPVRQDTMRLDHADFLDLMLDLRYKSDANERAAALKTMGTIATDLLGPLCLQGLEAGEFPLQLDIVVNPAELAALPFETATDSEGRPLLVRRDRPIELTRRVRQDFAETRMRWPSRPRILFVWACPPGAGVEVPSKAHGDALLAALEPWIPLKRGAEVVPDPSRVLTTLAEAGLGSIEKACRDAIEMGNPFTHVHILAHGYPVGRAHRQQFGMALHSERGGDLETVTPEALTDALAPLRGRPVVVTLAVCDGANMTNTVAPQRSIAHQLHVSGLPVVVASQLPLTVSGSSLLVERFYGALLAGEDVRSALHEARAALYDSRDRTGHDWASLVGYVRLPEGYAEHLLEVRLEAVLASLKTAQSWSDALVAGGENDPAQFERVAALLRGRIEQLRGFLNATEKIGKKGLLEENLGLLGSAQKRLAELYFERGRRGGVDSWLRPMRESLEEACDSYRRSCENNLSHHWTGVQQLSLEAVLRGIIGEPGRWHAAAVAAGIDRNKPGEYWAHGSLAELFLLAQVAGQAPRIEEAARVLEEMKARVRDFGGSDRFPLESTERQLRRYTGWWTNKNGFFPGVPDLSAEAGRLIEVLLR